MNTIRTPIQIVTVIFSLTMLAGYVVYSQRHQTRTVASSSKGGVISGVNGRPENLETNAQATLRKEFLASSSKSIQPAIDIRHLSRHENGSNQPARLIMPGSKSTAQLIVPGSKSRAPLIELQTQDVTNQISATNSSAALKR